MRLVLIIITYLLFIPAGNTADFSKYKSTCSDIGFTPDTDPFADCVLKLYKRDRAKIKTQVNKEIENQREREREQALEIERQAREREARQNQANYERERLKLEKQRLAMEKKRAEREQFEREQKAWQGLIDWGNSTNELNDLNACISQCQYEDYTRSHAYCKRMCR